MTHTKYCNTISTIIHFYMKLSRYAMFYVTSYLVGYISHFLIVCLNITEDQFFGVTLHFHFATAKKPEKTGFNISLYELHSPISRQCSISKTPLKTSKNLWFSDLFRGYRYGTLESNRLLRVWELKD